MPSLFVPGLSGMDAFVMLCTAYLSTAWKSKDFRKPHTFHKKTMNNRTQAHCEWPSVQLATKGKVRVKHGCVKQFLSSPWSRGNPGSVEKKWCTKRSVLRATSPSPPSLLLLSLLPSLPLSLFPSLHFFLPLYFFRPFIPSFFLSLIFNIVSLYVPSLALNLQTSSSAFSVPRLQRHCVSCSLFALYSHVLAVGFIPLTHFIPTPFILIPRSFPVFLHRSVSQSVSSRSLLSLQNLLGFPSSWDDRLPQSQADCLSLYTESLTRVFCLSRVWPLASTSDIVDKMPGFFTDIITSVDSDFFHKHHVPLEFENIKGLYSQVIWQSMKTVLFK